MRAKVIHTKIYFLIAFLIPILLLLLSACKKEKVLEEDPTEIIDDTEFETTDWTTATHTKDVDPNFDEVFQDNQVKRIDIVILPSRWQNMLDNMTELHGAFGVGSDVPLPDEDPIYVPAEIFYNGIEWYRVGVRFKGNSSLRSSWRNGIMKLSLKLDFDEFEDTYPQINNQRFYGFKKLHLKNNFKDKSFLREKIAGDAFREYGLVASHTAFYTVYIDSGEGPIYFGLYTMVEEVDGSVLDTQFSSDDGNLYKPDRYGASFREGSFSEIGFVKKTNEDDADWSDVISVFSVLHDDSRTSTPETWRANLETVFDTDVFLKYLAVNTVIQNWDTYGRMAHNYYLYNNPDTNKLTWIPWDNNEALQHGIFGGSLSIDFSDLENNHWPLIEYLYADEIYKARYDTYIEEVINGIFEPSYMQDKYSNYRTLLEQYATSELDSHTFLDNDGEFFQALQQLNTHVTERTSVVTNYLY